MKIELTNEYCVPLTIESSIRIIDFPKKFCESGPNFLATANRLNLIEG
jgi:hypothetical protein